MTSPTHDAIDVWLRDLEARHLRDLTPAEVRRAIQALSTSYVHRRDRVANRTFDGAGKRAAFALYYAPLHFFFLRGVLAETRDLEGFGVSSGASKERRFNIVDLGCGTAVAGAAWALAMGPKAEVDGIERNRWAAKEASHTLRTLGVRGRTRPGDVSRWRARPRVDGIVVAYTVNELEDSVRDRLLIELLAAVRGGAALWVIEPIARGISPWWDAWCKGFASLGGQSATWELEVQLPELLQRFDRASGLNHRTLKGRTLMVPGRAK